MRLAALAAVLAVSGCATPQATSKPIAPKAAAKREVTVYGRGAPSPPPGEISIAPKDQGLSFSVDARSHTSYRCTKTDSKDPDERVYCRNLSNGDSRDPDPGRLERSKTQSTWH